jgi:hypothetical protein
MAELDKSMIANACETRTKEGGPYLLNNDSLFR